MNSTRRTARGSAAAVAGLAIAATLIAGCSSGSSSSAAAAAATSSPSAAAVSQNVDAQTGLYSAMHELWSQHMEWTYATVDAFFHDPKALQPSLDRLLRNQHDIGAAIVPFYGQAAGDKLTALLVAHINDAVPVLKAAQAGDAAALKTASDAWYANAKQIADLLSSANSRNWPTSATEPMLQTHISQTTAYAVDLLKGDYAQAITDYDKAEQHMAMLADTLAKGIIAQFPDKFAS